jgi:hypothetical protein
MITNATKEQLERAMLHINRQYFNGNICFKGWKEQGRHLQFTLTVHDSKGPGSRHSHTGRRIAAACWHAHGYLFEALFKVDPRIWVQVSLHGNQRITIEGGNWQDRNIGSVAQPMLYSEACDCEYVPGIGG